MKRVIEIHPRGAKAVAKAIAPQRTPGAFGAAPTNGTHGAHAGTNGTGTNGTVKPTFTRRVKGRNPTPIDASAKITSKLAPRVAGVGTDVLTITPEMADEFLKGKLPNRPLKEFDIERYIRDIKAGAWHLNGEAMIFSGTEDDVRNGRTTAGLLDGQQRCWAICMAEKGIQTVVTWGVPQDSMESIDVGARRTFSDVLSIKGRHYTAATSGATRLWMWYESNTESTTGTNYTHASHNELLHVFDRHPSLEEAAKIVGSSNVGRLLSPAIATFVVSGAIEYGLRDEAAAFMSALAKGMDPSREWGQTHPVYHLYQRLQKQRTEKERTPQLVTAAYVLKAFNAFAHNKSLRALRWSTGGERPEPFPRFEKPAQKAQRAGVKA